MIHKADVAVVGAGVAGLAAARALAEAGLSVLVLEARDRIGGRIFTVRDPRLDFPIELGAEFLHGFPQNLWALVREAGLATWELNGRQLCFEKGKLRDCGIDDHLGLLDKITKSRSRDLPFAEYLRAHQVGSSQAEWILSYVEGFNAADSNVIGIRALAKQQKAENAIDGDRISRLVSGYDRIPEFLAQKFCESGGWIEQNFVVNEIRWRRGSAEIRCRRQKSGPSTIVNAAAVVITVPLGVLQSARLRFVPSPADILTHARRMAMGSVRRISLCFKTEFWNSQRKPPVSFIFSRNETPPTWWTSSPLLTSVLTGWIGGPRANRAKIKADEALLNSALRTLGKMFSTAPARLHKDLRAWYTHDWQHDPFTLGAYSYVPAGALDASARMSRPVQGTLFFAGEHTDVSGHWGTVHGALGSGERAARQVLRALRGS